MTARRLREVLRGFVSLLALAVLVIGPPVGLAAFVGWPLPTSIPTLDELSNALKLGIDDIAVVKTLAILAWLAWAQVAVSVATETAAALRGRAADRLPILPGIQASVGRLVASVALVGSTTLSGAHFPAAASTAVGAEPISLVSPHPGPPAGTPVTHHGTATPPPAPPRQAPAPDATVTVEPHDSYWAIAERLHGDGLRWREIRDLNVGRTMPDGTVIHAHSDRLMPGWVLVVPNDAAASAVRPARPQPAAATPAPEASTRTEAVVRPGDSMWRLAEDHLTNVLGRPPVEGETAAYCGRFIDANRDRLADPHDPDLIYAGQTFLFPDLGEVDAGSRPLPPTTPAPAETRAPSTSAPARPDPPVPSPSPSTGATTASTVEGTPTTRPAGPSVTTGPPAARPTPSHPGPDGTNLPAVAASVIASALLAVGITWAVRRRRAQRNHLSPSQPPAPPADEPFHRQVIAAADEDGLEVLMAALADLSRQLAESGQACRPRIVQHGPEHLDVVVDVPTTPAPGGWRSEADGRIWSRDTNTISTEGPLPWMSPAPLLVTLGQPDEDGQIYLDVETAGVTTLVGDTHTARNLLRAIATELANSPLGEVVQMLVVGDLGMTALVDECEKLIVVESWDEALSDLAAWAAGTHRALTATGYPNPFVARRGRDPEDDSLVPLVVVATHPPEAPGDLAFLLEHPSAAGAVFISDTPLPGSTVVECMPDELSLPQFGLGCMPAALEEDTADKVAELLRTASESANTQLEFDLPVDLGGNGADVEVVPAAPYRDPSYDILVRYLGDVTVEGTLRRLAPKELAAVSYVALHRSVTIDRTEDALWASPTTDTRRDRIFHIMSACRTAMRGGENLRTGEDGYYSVGPNVRTDLELFDARVQAAAHEPQRTIAADLVLDALSLCTGPVFSTRSADRDSFAWIEAANLKSHWETKLTDTAHELAEDCLDHDDTPRALKASEAGLQAMPTHTHCTEALMRAHAANGNLAAVQRVFQEHVTALELIHLDQPAPSTSDLYERLIAPT